MAFYFTQLYRLYLQNKNVYLLKSLYPLKFLASPDLPFKMVANFPYALTKEFGANSKFGGFLKEIAPARTKKLMIF